MVGQTIVLVGIASSSFWKSAAGMTAPLLSERAIRRATWIAPYAWKWVLSAIPSG